MGSAVVRRLRRIPLRLVLAIAVVAALVFWRGPLVRVLGLPLASLATGYGIAADDLAFDGGSLAVSGLHVSSGGLPLLDVARVRARYDLGALVQGHVGRGAPLALDLVSPVLSLTRRADGGFGIRRGTTGPVAHGATPGAAPLPLDLDVRVRGGAIRIVDDSRKLPESRRFTIDGLTGFILTRGTRTAGSIGGVLRDADAARTPLGLTIVDDAVAEGSEIRVRIPHIALRAPVDYLIDTPIARVASGAVRDLDVRWYRFGGGPYHLVGSGRLAGTSMLVPGVAARLHAFSATIGLSDDAVTFRHGTADLGTVRGLRIAGGLYDFSAPRFDVGFAVDRARLPAIARLFTFSQHLPIAGDGRAHVRLSGPVGSPLVAIGIDLHALAYGRYPIAAARGGVLYYAGALDIAGLRARYGALDLDVNGEIGLASRTTFELTAIASGATAAVPYLAQALPLARLAGAGLLTGTNRALDARGVLAAAGPSGTFDGFFHVDPSGVGSFGPLALARSDGTGLQGAFLLDRRDGASGFWLDTQGVDFAGVRGGVLPGLDAFHPPAFAGRFTGRLAGVSTPAGFRFGGHVRGRDVVTGPVRLTDVDADVGGALDRLALGRATADGPFGRFAGTGTYAGGTLALAGRYDGSFDRIRAFTGDLGARGEIHGPVALAIGTHATLVQARDVLTPGARVRGVPLDRIAGSFVATTAGLRIYAARASVAGGSVAGAGGLATGPAGTARLAVSLDAADASRLRATGLGLSAGRLSGFGTLALLPGAARTTRADFDGGFDVASGAVRAPAGSGAPLAASGSGFVRLGAAPGARAADGQRATFRAATGLVAGAAGDVDGTIAGVGAPGGARYDLTLHVPSAEAAPLLARFAPAARDDHATVEGDLHVGGTGAAWALRGRLAVPSGDVNGLAFDSFAATVIVAPSELVLREGSGRVGSTRLSFAGGQRGDDGGLRVSSPHVHLADFDDLFDEGDTFAGDGRLLVRFRRRRGRIATTADTALRDVRVRSFALGDATATWNASGRRVTGRLAVGGASGTLDVAGSVDLSAHARLERILATSRFEGTARLRDLDLGVWLPAIGAPLPVTGRLDGDAVVRGTYPGFDLATTATLRDGTIDHLPVTRFRIVADSTLAQTRITSAELALPGLAVTGAGVVGLGPRGTVDVRVHGTSDDIGALALRLGAGLPVTGSGEVDVHVDGPRTRPRIAGGFDFEHAMAGPVPVPHALGEFQVQGRDVVLSDAEIAFTKSTLYLAGSVPLTVAPFGFGPAAAPITLELQTKGLDLSDFAPLLPHDATLAGRIDGRVRVGGTAGAPALFGQLTLAGGSLAAPLETTPIQNLGATVRFAGRQMTLQRLNASVGGGALDADGTVAFADLVRPSTDATYAFSAHGRRVKLDLPAYGRGTIDGNLRLTHAPGTMPVLAGEGTLSDAVIPFSALYITPPASDPGTIASTAIGPPDPASNAGSRTVAAAPAAQDLALALDVAAGSNVRVRSGNVDIGAKGNLGIRGTKAAPSLTGSFDSTGGTLTYFNTLFRVQRGTVTFEPDNGLIPNLDARATSHVSAPDPRNLSGAADVTIDVAGPVTNLNIQLSSDPPYNRDQILGLLFSVPAIGGSTLFNQQTALVPVTPFGTESTVAGTSTSTRPGDFSVPQEAFSVLNAQFTRNLLSPFESTFSEFVHLDDLNVNVDYSGQVGFTARKFLGHRVDAVFGESFGYPEQRQSFGFEFRPNDRFAAQITAFQSIGQQVLGVETPSALLHATTANPRLTSAQPIGGTAGFSLSLQRLF